MNNLKFRNNHSKGKSKYQITATMDDGSEETLNPVQWQDLTKKRHDTICKSYITEMNDRANGLESRDMRMIVGLDSLVRRPYRPVRKKNTSEEQQVLMNKYIMGRI